MGESIDTLSDILARECRLYWDLYELARKKSELIVNGDVDGLTGILSVEQQLIIKLGDNEAQREQLIEDWAAGKGIDPQKTTLAKIISHVEGNTKKSMEKVWEDLTDVISQLKRTNDLNESLLKSNLEYIDFSIKLLAGQDESGVSYSKGGKTATKSQNRNLFDRKV